MRSKTHRKLAIVFALVLVGFFVLYAFPVEADKSHVEFETSLTVPAGTYQYRTTAVYVPSDPESVEHTASFLVPSGASVKFCLLVSTSLWQLWQDGLFQPSWIEGSRGELGVGGSSQSGEYINYYLVVQNDGSSSQEVNLCLSKTWHESNKVGLLSGSAMVSLGIGIVPLLMLGKSRLHLEFSGTVFAMAFIMVFLLTWAQYLSSPPDPFFTTTQALPVVLFFEAFPLIALLYLLEKSNGFARFKNWNTGIRLRIAGVLLLSGFTTPVAFQVLRIASLLFFGRINPDELTAFSLILGGSLMLIGLVLFVGLWAINYRRECLLQA